MIVVENLVKHFGPTVAVDGISFEVHKGDVMGFLGPNGAGKTTTLRVLTCFQPATSGRAVVAGHDTRQDPIAVRRAIGYLPENVPMYPEMRVREYLTYRAALKGVPRARRNAAVEQAMERCGVVEVQRKLVGHVSRGYRQRVGLADALVADPPILVLDEPTSGLDPNQRRRIKALIRELSEEHTILFSSHILSEVEDVSNRILVIHRGRLQVEGRPGELLAHSEGRRLTVTARAPAAVLEGILAAIPGIEEQSVDEDGADGYATAHARVAADADPRDRVAETLSARGIALRELRLDLPTLEEYFQQITEGRDQEVTP